jgi:hypothetical protein
VEEGENSGRNEINYPVDSTSYALIILLFYVCLYVRTFSAVDVHNKVFICHELLSEYKHRREIFGNGWLRTERLCNKPRKQ